MLKVKRAYDAPEPGDGFRILVDRIWPRGLTKEKVKADLWLREIGPSDGLRKWFAHDRSKWVGFKKKYSAELEGKPELVGIVSGKAGKGTVTLLFGAKDLECNQAVALKEYIEKLGKPKRA